MQAQRNKWSLHSQAFEQLLCALGPDRESAGEAYERLRRRLVKFFSWERCPEPEVCADESLNRIARTLERGEEIRKMDQYALGVARLVLLEAKARARKVAAMPAPAQVSTSPEPDENARALMSLERCMESMTPEQRLLLIEYYSGTGQARIDNRRRLAERLGIELNALRNRAMRLRERVEECVRDRLEKDSQ
jgi:DNA-directed RNA polymerase specialized sigma24 family protein